jgi:hypothetical protein
LAGSKFLDRAKGKVHLQEMAQDSRERIKAVQLGEYSLLKHMRVPQCRVVGKMTAREEGTLCQNS